MLIHPVRLRIVLFGLLSILFASIVGPARAQQIQRSSLRQAQSPLVPLQNRRTRVRPSAHPFRYLDSIRVRFHDADKEKKANIGAAVEAAAVKEPVTQVLSDAELADRGVPAMTRMRGNPKLGIQVYQLADPSRRDEALAKLRKMPEVRYAEPVQAVHPLLPPPNDTYFNLLDTTSSFFENTWLYQWQLQGDFTKALAGWSKWPNKYYTAAEKIAAPGPKLAIIDTGIDYLHPDFVNAGGITTDAALGGQIDLDDSYDFNGQTDDPLDLVGHGTHVAGIAAAATNNSEGVAAIGYPARIMALNVFDESANGDDVDVIDALVWAADHGAVVCNLSLAADGGYSQGLQDAVDYAWSKNMLVVAAAGNDGVDYVRRYPGACNKVLCVAATGFTGPGTLSGEGIASYSTYGSQVSIAAPGGDFSYWTGGELGLSIELNTTIWSTTPTYPVSLVPPGNYGYQQGTSMASPHVAGLAALYAGYKGFTQASPDAPRKIIRAIQRGADNLNGRVDGGWSITTGYGRINVEATMKEQLGLNRLANLSYTPGGVTGQVTYYGTPVLNASIKLQATLRKSYTANSKEDGTYRVPNVYPALYTVTCKWQGITQTKTVTVEQGCDTLATDFTLETGSTVLTPQTLTFSPNPVTGGNSVTGTLKLSGVAPAGGVTVTLSNSNTTVATVPASIVVAAGNDTKTFTITTTAVAADTTVNIGATCNGSTLTSALTVKKPAGTAIRVNCGGPSFTAGSGNVFAADAYFTGGATLTRVVAIANTGDPALYHTMRYGASFAYSIPVSNGTYTVKLHFAETNGANFGNGLRTMDVTINGALTYPALDVFASAGANAALVKTSTVTVTNGKIDISIAKKAGSNAFINAIEVIP